MLTHLSWRELLTRWSDEVLAIPDLTSTTVTPAMRAARWIGSPPASAADVRGWETRTGRAMPPSYRAFLEVTDGWPLVEFAYDAIRPVSEVGWVRDVDPGLLSGWEAGYGPEDEDDVFADDGPPLLRRSLLLTTGPDNLLLDSGHVADDGEWDFCTFTNWYPGVGSRAGSFRAGLEAQYATFVRFQVPESRTRDEVGEQVERAYRDCLGGNDDGNDTGDVFAAARSYGDPRAEVLDVQFRVLTDVHGAVSGVVNLEVDPVGPDPVLVRELWPLLVESDRHRESWQGPVLDLFLQGLSDEHRSVVRDLAARCERDQGLTADFSYAPAFDHEVQRARTLLRGGRRAEAVSLLIDALPSWQPLSPLHLAPVGLLWDRELGPLMTGERRHLLLTTPRARG